MIGNIRPYLKKIWLADSSGGASGDVLVLRLHKSGEPQVLPEYLHQVLSSDRFSDFHNRYARGGAMPRGDKQAVLRFKLPLPPITAQAHIVEILSRFDALVNDLSSGLPAEIAARRKQYEYYRDQLLAFEEVA